MVTFTQCWVWPDVSARESGVTYQEESRLTQLGPKRCPTPIFSVLPASISFLASSNVGFDRPGASHTTASIPSSCLPA